MATFTRILVDVDSTAGRHPALEQAFELAKRTGASVTIVDVLPHVPKAARLFATVDIEQELIDNRLQALGLIAKHAPDGISVKTGLLRGRAAHAIVAEAARLGADLVMRSHNRDLAVPPPPFGPVDLQLLRQCPCPVWIVGPGSGGPPSRIAAFVDASTDRPEEQALNQSILDTALTMRDLWDAKLTVVHAWNPFGEELLRARMNAADFDAYQVESRESATKALDAVVAGPRAAGVATELIKAEPHEAILGLVESAGIDLVVMGTVARSGIAGVVVGNTAERVLRELRQSVLAIKPEGFRSSLVD
jgi:nucleotide-binding universal stress UspA family protein